MAKIKKIVGRQVFDSRGNPTVEAEVFLVNKVKASSIVPSGASTGAFEAHELRDNNKNYFLGKSVLNAVKNINTIINKNLKPQLSESDDFKTTIDVITKNLLGAAVVIKNNKPIGIITDGDIRRVFSFESNFKILPPSFSKNNSELSVIMIL